MAKGLRRILLVLVLVSLMSGCVDDPGGRENPDLEDPEPREPYAAQNLYLNPEQGLVHEAPKEPGSVPAGDFILKWTTGDGEHPRFDAALDATEMPVWISPSNASVTLHLTTDRPVLPAEGALPDVAVWLGSGQHVPLVGSTALDGPLMPDEVATVTFELPGPQHQPPILALSGVSMLVTVTMTQHEEHNVQILTGGDHASHVKLESRPMHIDDFQNLTEDTPIHTEEVSGELLLFDRLVGPAPGPGLNYAEHEIPVAEHVQILLVSLAAVGGGHTVDMDIALLDPDGGTITRGVTPYASEWLWLMGNNLEPYRGQTLTLHVANHLGVNMEYEGIIQTG